MGNLSVDTAVVEFIRTWIKEQQREGRTGEEIAESLGCSRTQMINIRDHARGVGPKVQDAFANLLFKGSIDALRRAAKGEPEVATVATGRNVDMDLDRFELTDEELIAVEYALRVEKLSPQAILNTFETHYKGADRLQGEELLEEFRHENRKLKRGR